MQAEGAGAAAPSKPAAKPAAVHMDDMSEDEQMRIAMEMSLQAEAEVSCPLSLAYCELTRFPQERKAASAAKPAPPAAAAAAAAGAPAAAPAKPPAGTDVDMTDVMNDPAFVANLLQTLPGVDPNDPGIKVLRGELVI